MDYREYRKKYGAGQTGSSSDTGENLPRKSGDYKNGGGASSETGSVTRHYRSVSSHKKKYSAKKQSGAARWVLAAIIGITLLLILTVVLAVVTNQSFRFPDYLGKKLRVEAGTAAIQASDFLKDKSHTAEFPEGTEYSLDRIGEYSLNVVIDGREMYSVTLEVVDTKAPTAQGKTVRVRLGEVPSADQCVFNVQDVDEVTVSFAENYSFTQLGTQNVTVRLEDAAGNVTEVPATVMVVKNTDLLTEEVDLEIGNPFPDISEFLGISGNGTYTENVGQLDVSHLGNIETGIEVNGKRYTVTVHVVDTVAPVGNVIPVSYYNAAYPDPAQFFSSITDVTNVTVSFLTQPAWDSADRVAVRLQLTDEGGNKTVYDSFATHLQDNVPPTLKVVKSLLEYTVGDGALVWRSCVEATDNSGEEVELSLEYNTAILQKAGIYTVYAVARDIAGNETRQPLTLEVTDRDVSLEMLYTYIKPIADSLNLTNLSQKKQAEKIFQYLQANKATQLHYTEESPHDDWIKQAYLALSGNRHGDCFVFAAVAQGIFRYLGYETVIVAKTDAAVTVSGGAHFWVMVNFNKDDPQNDHWYHFDGCPQTGAVRDPAFYMMTTQQVKIFTEWRDKKLNRIWRYYEFDESAYPASETTVAVPFTNKELVSFMQQNG